MISTSESERTISAAIDGLRSIVARRDGDEIERLLELCRALDALVMAYHDAPETEPDDGSDAPRIEFEPIMQGVSDAFPSLGPYPDVDPTDMMDQELLCGLGYDDLSDILRDLADVEWYFSQGRPETGIWDFRFGYQSHWGHHLHDLRRYLHRRLY